MWDKISVSLVSVCLFVEGYVLWSASLALTGQTEPWDSSLFFLAVLFSGLAIGALVRQADSFLSVAAVLSLWAGQVAAIATVPHLRDQRLWFPLGTITTGIGALFVLVGITVGRRARKRLTSRAPDKAGGAG